MFRIRKIVIAALAVIIAGVLAYFVLLNGKNYGSSLKEANKRYHTAASVDYAAEEQEFRQKSISRENLQEENDALVAEYGSIGRKMKEDEAAIKKEKTDEIEQQIAVLREQRDADLLEYNILCQSIADDDPHFSADGEKDVIHALNVSVKDPNSTNLNPLDDVCELVKWSHLTTDGDCYTCKYVGYEAGLATMMQTLAENLSGYDVSFGNYSMRQIYNAYANTRSWDGSTLLAWYNNSFVTGTGVVAQSADDLMRGRFTQAGQLAESSAAIEQAIKEDQAKLEEEYAERANTLRVSIDESIASIMASSYNDETKASLRAQIEAGYQKDLAALQKALETEKAKVEEKYKEQAEDEASDLSLYDLSDKNLLIYVFDITFTVRTKQP